MSESKFVNPKYIYEGLGTIHYNNTAAMQTFGALESIVLNYLLSQQWYVSYKGEKPWIALFMTQKELGEELNIPLRSVKRILAKLKGLGVIRTKAKAWPGITNFYFDQTRIRELILDNDEKRRATVALVNNNQVKLSTHVHTQTRKFLNSRKQNDTRTNPTLGPVQEGQIANLDHPQEVHEVNDLQYSESTRLVLQWAENHRSSQDPDGTDQTSYLKSRPEEMGQCLRMESDRFAE